MMTFHHSKHNQCNPCLSVKRWIVQKAEGIKSGSNQVTASCTVVIRGWGCVRWRLDLRNKSVLVLCPSRASYKAEAVWNVPSNKSGHQWAFPALKAPHLFPFKKRTPTHSSFACFVARTKVKNSKFWIIIRRCTLWSPWASSTSYINAVWLDEPVSCSRCDKPPRGGLLCSSRCKALLSFFWCARTTVPWKCDGTPSIKANKLHQLWVFVKLTTSYMDKKDKVLL